MAILEVHNLTVEFSGFKAISNLNFSLNEGEIRVIIGPNGAGKTTLMDVITGKTKATEGKIFFKGEEITGLHPSAIALLGIGRKFQGPNIFERLTVQENIEVALKGKHRIFSTFFIKNSAERQQKIEDILEQIGLIERRDHLAHTLSHGEKQWLEMGMLLVQDPELIILDEPTTGMTIEETKATGQLIQSIFKGRSVIVIEHDMTFVRQIANVVTVLHQGQLLTEGSFEDVEQNKQVQEVYFRGAAHADDH